MEQYRRLRFVRLPGLPNGCCTIRLVRVVRIFPNREACLRLVTALAVEQSEEWLTGRRYLDMSELNEHRREKAQAEGVVLIER